MEEGGMVECVGSFLLLLFHLFPLPVPGISSLGFSYLLLLTQGVGDETEATARIKEYHGLESLFSPGPRPIPP